MPASGDDVARWRALAAEALAEAEQTSNQLLKVSLIETAIGYRRLIEAAEERLVSREWDGG
jgi:hypothetical protein